MVSRDRVLLPCLLLALVPCFVLRATFMMPGGVSRREALGVGAAGAAALTSALPAAADWQGENARMLQVYGKAIVKLDKAVETGDLDALRSSARKISLYSAVYNNSPSKRKEYDDIAGPLLEAIDSGNVDVVKTKYGELLKYTNVKELLSRPISGARMVSTASSMAGYQLG